MPVKSLGATRVETVIVPENGVTIGGRPPTDRPDAVGHRDALGAARQVAATSEPIRENDVCPVHHQRDGDPAAFPGSWPPGSRLRAVFLACAVGLPGYAASASARASGPAAASPFASPIDTGLEGAVVAGSPDERLTVLGRRRVLAPAPDCGDARPPWEVARAIRDPRTGTDTTAFGNAYNLGSPLGSDERGNETGGTLLAPRHP